MPVKWYANDVPDWFNIPVSGLTLSMALYGFTESGNVTITWENHVAVAKYVCSIHPIHDEKGRRLSLNGHIRLMRMCIGFRRTYN